MTELRYYLMTYDAAAQHLADLHEFSDEAEAERAFVETEEEHRNQGTIQVVLFTADSVDTLKSTHPHYFRPNGDTAPFPVVTH